jgi:hypothetical protein
MDLHASSENSLRQTSAIIYCAIDTLVPLRGKPAPGLPAVGGLRLALGGGYGSGLPVDLGKGPSDTNFLLAQFGAAIVNRVNFSRGRVRQNFAMDAAAGAELYRKEQRSAAVQIQVDNLTDRLNVINFASLFSGTAVAPPRSVSARLKFTF